MTFRLFLEDIIYEISDRIVAAERNSKLFVEQIIENRLCPSSASSDSPKNQNQTEDDAHMNLNSEKDEKIFGIQPRLIKPLLNRIGRRHEIDAHRSNSDASLFQVKAVRQKLNGACGYYSLYHSSMTIIARECRTDADSIRVMRLLFDRAFFFTMMARWKQMLIDRVHHMQQDSIKKLKRNNRPSYEYYLKKEIPWNLPTVKSGVVERAFMDFLLEHDPFIASIKKWTGASFHALPEVSLSVLKSRLSLAALNSFQEISNQIQSDFRAHAFLIGQLNHWIAIVSNRVPVDEAQDDFIDDNPKLINTHENQDENLMDIDHHSSEDIYNILNPRRSTRNKRKMEIDVIETNKPRKLKSKAKEFNTAHLVANSKCQMNMETILLDSRNDFVLNMKDESFKDRVAHRMREFPHNGSMWHDLLVRLYENSLKDTQFSCVLFHNLSSQTVSFGSPKISASAQFAGANSSLHNEKEESQSITTDLIMLSVRGFFESYSTHTGDHFDLESEGKPPPLRDEDVADWMFKFTLWIQEYSPLRVIETNVCDSLRNVKKAGYLVPISVAEGFSSWISHLKSRIHQAQSQAEQNEDFQEIVHDLVQNTIPVIQKTIKYLKNR